MAPHPRRTVRVPPPQTSEMVLSAVRHLTSSEEGTGSVGARPKDVVRYIRRVYHVRAPWVKRDVTNALRWAVEFGLVHRPKRGVYVPAPENDAVQEVQEDALHDVAAEAARRDHMLRSAVDRFRMAGMAARLRAAAAGAEYRDDEAGPSGVHFHEVYDDESIHEVDLEAEDDGGSIS